MKKLWNKSKEYFLPIYLIINILYVLIGSFLFFFVKKIDMKVFANGYIILLGINIILILLLFLLKKYKFKKVDIFLILVCILSFISYIFAYKKNVALYGAYHRYEGLFMYLYYMTIAFISSFVRDKYKKNVVSFILFTGFAELIVGICQKLGLFGIYTIIQNGERFANGFTNNPNFFAILMLLCLSISIGIYNDIKINKLHQKILLLSLICLYTIGLLIANTTSCMVGLIVVLIYLFIYSKKNKDYKKFRAISILIVVITIIINLIGYSNQINDLGVAARQGAKVSIGEARPEYGTARIYIWTKTLEVVPKYIWTGIGIDNFKYIIDGKPIPYWSVIDKCHNEYLQMLVTMGIFTLLSYIGLYYCALYEGIKKSFKNKETYLLLPVIGYIIQAFFNISVIEVSPLFYIVLGLLVGSRIEDTQKKI